MADAAIAKMDGDLKSAVKGGDIAEVAGLLRKIYGANFDGAGTGLAKTIKKMKQKHPEAKIQNACQKILDKWGAVGSAASTPKGASASSSPRSSKRSSGPTTAQDLKKLDAKVKGLVKAKDDDGLLKLVSKLAKLTVTVDSLAESGIGKTINRCAKKHSDADVKAQCTSLINQWKTVNNLPTPKSAAPTPRNTDTGTESTGVASLQQFEKLLAKLKSAGKNKDNKALLAGFDKLRHLGPESIPLLTESGIASFVRRLSEKHPDEGIKNACASLFQKWKHSRGSGAQAGAAPSQAGSRSAKLSYLVKRLVSTEDPARQRDIAKKLYHLKVSATDLLEANAAATLRKYVASNAEGIDGKLKKMCERLLKLWDASKAELYTPKSSKSQQQAARKLEEAKKKQSARAKRRQQMQDKAKAARDKARQADDALKAAENEQRDDDAAIEEEERRVHEEQVNYQNGTEQGSYRQRLIYFYSRFNPSKLGQVDYLLKKYKGKEESVLFAALRHKYSGLGGKDGAQFAAKLKALREKREALEAKNEERERQRRELREEADKLRQEAQMAAEKAQREAEEEARAADEALAAQREKERIESEADARARRRGGKSDALGMASIRSAADRRRSNNDSDSDSDIDWGDDSVLEDGFGDLSAEYTGKGSGRKKKNFVGYDDDDDDSEFGFGSNAAASKFLGKIGRKKSADGIFNDEDGADLPETGDGENVSEFLSAADKKLAALESGVEESTKKSRSPRRRKSGSPRRKQESSVVQSTSTSVSESVFEGVKEKKKKKSVEIDIDVNEYVAKHDRRAQDSDSDEDMF